VTQQLGFALQQLCQHLAQSLQGQQGSMGIGQSFGQSFGQQPFGQQPFGQQPFGQQPFGMGGQSFGQPFGGGIGAQGAFSQGWGAGRSPTIQ
jgi:hypothetical protein